jgi:DNA mismatch repair protein MSH6
MGQSTFQVELEETSVMLAHASRYSLVILDELGRGTSTFDGYAIAYAVVQDLASRLKCRTLLSTHYFPLTDEFGLHPNVATYHMACKVDDNSKSVVFLYKFLRGVCPKSYGLNVALHAGIPLSVVDRADRIAQDFESESGFHIADPLLRLHRMYHSLTNDAMVM